jgi:hypothetical protein
MVAPFREYATLLVQAANTVAGLVVPAGIVNEDPGPVKPAELVLSRQPAKVHPLLNKVP